MALPSDANVTATPLSERLQLWRPRILEQVSARLFHVEVEISPPVLS